MASILKVDTIQDQSGNNIINENANTITIGASGDTINIVGTLQNNGNNAVGITEADQWRLTADATSNQEPISANLERVDTDGFGYIGTGMSESSGIFTFPSTGVWRVEFNGRYSRNGETRFIFTKIATTTNNSTYSTAAQATSFLRQAESNFTVTGGYACFIFNVTDTSTHKVRFDVTSSQSITIGGDTNVNDTYMTFTRLGDSV